MTLKQKEELRRRFLEFSRKEPDGHIVLGYAAGLIGELIGRDGENFFAVWSDARADAFRSEVEKEVAG